MFQRILAIIQKELIQAYRDRVTLAVMLSMPLLQLILFGYAISTNVQHIPMVVVDQSLDQRSRSYIAAMVNSGYFDAIETQPDQAGAIAALDSGRVKAGLVIPPQFADHVQRGGTGVFAHRRDCAGSDRPRGRVSLRVGTRHADGSRCGYRQCSQKECDRQVGREHRGAGPGRLYRI